MNPKVLTAGGSLHCRTEPLKGYFLLALRGLQQLPRWEFESSSVEELKLAAATLGEATRGHLLSSSPSGLTLLESLSSNRRGGRSNSRSRRAAWPDVAGRNLQDAGLGL